MFEHFQTPKLKEIGKLKMCIPYFLDQMDDYFT